MTMPSKDQVKGEWKQAVGAAKTTWGKLTDDELMQAEGQLDKLVGTIQERYAITRDEAQKQVDEFKRKHQL